MKVWLVTVGEPLPTDSGGVRLLRVGILANMLSEAGHEVVWWNSTFDHSQKKHRASSNTDIQYKDNFLIKLLRGCGYSANISLRRIWDHLLVARQFKKLSRNMSKPDVILCSLPTLELSWATVSYGRKHGVPVILDIRDLWPDLFLEHVPAKLRFVAKLLLLPMKWMAIHSCRRATAITGCAPDFVEWGLNLANRKANPTDKYFPFGYSVGKISATELESAKTKWQSKGITRNRADLIACFFGTLGAQFDIETVIESARQLKDKNASALFVICGAGESLERYKNLAKDLDSVIFPGWVGAADIKALMDISDVGLAPYYESVGFKGNIPNKTIEYLSAGLPVVSSLRGYFEDFLREQQCGVSYAAGDSQALTAQLLSVLNNKSELSKMKNNASSVFNERFKAENVYGDMIKYLHKISLASGSINN
ncbi:MAG: hypothetical protein OM95_00265 [Bdellovibrio sp. ArHS]|uniref:glycosyltransferase family 4 protein n=1 Tax=Bdellovibrio sp. ArHS TaxID=1569284 RepID=UPI00058364D8|nr:glycosyltransferase family 4 protein [Bdellovibrio sp. ArHS]KHD89998.1 MAG: hypothetical protein OM95_00265 [Bdellovibrio sp. ArHS]